MSGWTVTFDPSVQPTADTVVSADYTYILDDAFEQATGIITTDILSKSQMAQRGMIGLQSLRVAEVALTQMSPSQMATKNNVTIPQEAANYLDGFVFGSIG